VILIDMFHYIASRVGGILGSVKRLVLALRSFGWTRSEHFVISPEFHILDDVVYASHVEIPIE